MTERITIYAIPEKTAEFVALVRQAGVPDLDYSGVDKDYEAKRKITDEYHDNPVTSREVGKKFDMSHTQVIIDMNDVVALWHANSDRNIRRRFPLKDLNIARKPIKGEVVIKPKKGTLSERAARVVKTAKKARTKKQAEAIIPHITRSMVQQNRDLFQSPWKLGGEEGVHLSPSKSLAFLEKNNIPYGATEEEFAGRKSRYIFVLPNFIDRARKEFRKEAKRRTRLTA